MPFTVEDLALAALVRILPRSRYRIAAQTDARFQAFAGNTSRIAYRQQGTTPAFLLFAGPGQNPQAAAMAAASWAEANWRPNAVQRKVRPGVVVVHVAPGNLLAPAGPVAGAAVPSAVWTVDSATGRVEASGNPPGSPPASEVRRAAGALMRGTPAPLIGELDQAERGVMQLRTVGLPRVLTGAVSICLVLIALRYGIGGIFSLLALPSLLGSGAFQSSEGFLTFAAVVVNVLLLAGIVLGAVLLFNIRNLAYRAPGFSSPVATTRNLAWGGYVAVMIALAVVLDGVIPSAEQRISAGSVQSQDLHVTVTVNDDGGEVPVVVGGDLTVDLSGWPPAEWPGVQFKSSNPSVLSLDAAPTPGARPVARFAARQVGVSRVDAASADGRYTYQLRVDAITG